MGQPPATKRELIDTGTDKRYVRRDGFVFELRKPNRVRIGSQLNKEDVSNERFYTIEGRS